VCKNISGYSKALKRSNFRFRR